MGMNVRLGYGHCFTGLCHCGSRQELVLPVIGCFFGNGDIMDVTFCHAGTGNLHEFRPRAHLVDRVATCIAHRSAHAADQLVH